MRALRFRVKNFRSIDHSGWIPLERVTAFVGRNESGKTSLLKALHKLNPATEERYDPQREFPRDSLLGEPIVLAGLAEFLGEQVVIGEDDRKAGSLPRQTKLAASRQGIDLLLHWKAGLARHLVASWAEQRESAPAEILDSASNLFSEMAGTLANIDSNGSNL